MAEHHPAPIAAALDRSPYGVFVHDLETGENTFANADFTRLTGLGPGALGDSDGANFLARVHPEDAERVLAHRKALRKARDGEVLEVEYRFRRSDGAWIRCRSRDSVLERDPDGAVRRIIGTLHDAGASTRAQPEPHADEAAARRQQEELELIYASAPVGLCALDRDLRYLRINDRLAEINGIPAAEHIGRTVREVLPALADEIEHRLLDVVQTGEPALDIEVNGETPARPGVRRTWIESWLPLHDADGVVVGVNVLAREVTDERNAQAALAESQARFAATFDDAAVGIAQVGLDGRFLRVNRWLCDITGYSSDELTRLSFQDITHPDDLEPDLGLARKLLSGQISDYSMEKRYRRKDGSLVWIKLAGSLVRRLDGSPDYFIAVIDEIGARRDAEARARTLAAIVETSSDFIGFADLDGRALYLNRAGQALVGLNGEEAVRATRVEDYLFPEDLPFVRETIMPTVLREGRSATDFRFRHLRTGKPIDVHWDVVRIDDSETGEPALLATVTRDIRKAKATEKSLREANRRKDEFLAVLGHELRNPMAPIRNAADILRLLDSGDDPRIARALDVLERQSAHLTRLLDDLLDVSRIIRGRLKLERRPVEVREIVQQAIEAVGPLVAERRHLLETTLPPAGLLVNADPVRLTQILLNLLHNAANYTREGGRIQIATETGAGQVIIRVSDNGPGIPPYRLAALFTPFVQGERPDGPPAGLGLGLTISRRLAELHGGHLEASSRWPRPGSEFCLSLPELEGPQNADDPHLPESSPGRSDLRVLIVEDNADVAGALAMLLEVLGYAVQTASNGKEALALAEDQCPRVALLDIGLPDMNGLELARRLRSLCPERARLLLVALTGYGHDEARERSFAAGFDVHLTKPVDRHALQALLQRVQ